MAEALAEARLSLDAGEFPVGAVVALRDDVVARAHWTGAAHRRLLDHAEVLALMAAERSGRVSRRVERQQATLYTTLEPCALCMGAAMTFLLGRIVFAAEAPVDGAANLPLAWQPPNGHPPDGMPYAIPAIVGGVDRQASIALIAEWVRLNPRHEWAAAYLPDAAAPR
jgi:tRNA(adenine34) deaminase